jgi:DNA-binding beta-propeller fold protein YncE
MTGGARQPGLVAASRRRTAGLLAALAAATLTAATLAGCGQAGQHDSPSAASAVLLPEHIVNAPKNLLAAAPPQAGGSMWMLAGPPSAGLFQFSVATGHASGSVSVSSSARSVAQSGTGMIGLATGTRRSGALELLRGTTPRPVRTVALPAPARQVVAGGASFYVLTAWPGAASVTIVAARTGAITGTVPVPADTVSVAVTPQGRPADIYVLERTGLVDEIATASGHIDDSFRVGTAGRALALSPDGDTLYVLKGTAAVSNVAVVSVATESVRRVLPAPSHCHGLLVSADGGQLYEVVGTASYGNIQVFAV